MLLLSLSLLLVLLLQLIIVIILIQPALLLECSVYCQSISYLKKQLCTWYRRNELGQKCSLSPRCRLAGRLRWMTSDWFLFLVASGIVLSRWCRSYAHSCSTVKQSRSPPPHTVGAESRYRWESCIRSLLAHAKMSLQSKVGVEINSQAPINLWWAQIA